MAEPVILSVHKLIDFVLRCGDIDRRFSTDEAFQEGTRYHNMLQKQMGSTYRKEVNLSAEVFIGETLVKLIGRADGIISEPCGIVVDEIKTTKLSLEVIRGKLELHKGQALCYAYMYLCGDGLDLEDISVQITYYQIDDKEIQRERFTYSRAEVTAFFEELCEKYRVWAENESAWKELRDATVSSSPFPFEHYRAGQRELASAVYRSIKAGTNLYAQAPTGIGKTLSCIFPSIKAIAKGQADKIFYLTAKTVTRRVAEDAAALLNRAGHRIRLVTLRAKDKACLCDYVNCDPEFCKYADGHFNRVNEAILAILDEHDIITPEITEEYAKHYVVCPHELALDISIFCDIVVGDYNHVFDPKVFLQRYFAMGGEDRDSGYIFLIDEAHNLADRVRDMYTAVLKRSDFRLLAKDLKEKTSSTKRLKNKASGVSKHLLEVQKSNIDERVFARREYDPLLISLAEKFAEAAADWLSDEANEGSELEESVLELYFNTLNFCDIAQVYDDDFKAITEHYRIEVTHTLFCLDPSRLIAGRLGWAKSAIMFSATLAPLSYYRELLGGSGEDNTISLLSPFESKNLNLAADMSISTKYNDRAMSILPIAEDIYAAVNAKTGNYFVFFPSFEYMKTVYDAFRLMYPGVSCIVQSRDMLDEQRAEFLARFDERNTETLVGFCVLGGIFSEGIDLKGERLSGCVIVGVGLPKISFRLELIKEYFDFKNDCGYEYAYTFPGMNKVLQAAGRVIRSEDDKGFVLLIDKRFGSPRYKELFPAHWSHIRYLRSADEVQKLFTADKSQNISAQSSE